MTAALFRHELRTQQRLYWGNPEAAFFTFLLPVLFLVLLGAVYGDSDVDGTRGATFLLAGMIGYGIAATAFAGLAISTVIRRESGVLKRVRGTPMTPGLYLAAVIASTLVVIALEVVLLIVVGRFGFDAELPDSAWSFAVVLLVGTFAFATLGLALTGLVRSADGSSAVVNAVYLPMTFISGAFFSPESLPAFLEAISDVLPLTYLLRLVRDGVAEGATVADQVGDLAVLAAWGVVGLAIAVRTFRWEPRES
jgi:ABC-2 type transport system permease protein